MAGLVSDLLAGASASLSYVDDTVDGKVAAQRGAVAVAVAVHASYTGWLFVLSPELALEKALIWHGLFALVVWMIVIGLLALDTRALQPKSERQRENST